MFWGDKFAPTRPKNADFDEQQKPTYNHRVTRGALKKHREIRGVSTVTFGSKNEGTPNQAAIAQILPLIGLSKLRWERPLLMLPEGMELDFGGVGKEYAVDRAFALLGALTQAPYLVNFGGDLRASAPTTHGPWQVGVERPGRDAAAIMLLDLSVGALATSGDTHRFLIRDGVRYGHVLDPRTGWPVCGGPRSVTVAAASCTEAGMWATLSLLKGKDAAAFLMAQGRVHWTID